MIYILSTSFMSFNWPEDNSSVLSGALKGNYICQLFKVTNFDKMKKCQWCKSKNDEVTLSIPKDDEFYRFDSCRQCMFEVINKTRIRIYPKC
jgi:hypothetical protein